MSRSFSVRADHCSTTFAISYGLSFAAIVALVVYTYLHHGKTIWRQYKSSTSEKPDVHMKMMRKYKEAPTWWYMSLFGIVCYTSYVAASSLLKDADLTKTDACARIYHDSWLADQLELVGFPTGCVYLVCLCAADWHHPGCHQQPDWPECADRVHLRLHPTRQAAGADDVSACVSDFWQGRGC